MITWSQGSPSLLMATARYLPYTGGTESHVYEVGRRLVQAGVRVTVLTTDPSGKLPRSEECNGVRVQRVPAWPAGADYGFAPGVYQTIAAGGWDLVHLQGVHTLVAPFAMLAASRAKIPYAVTFHTGGHSSKWRNAVRGEQWRSLRPLLSHANQLIAVSKFEADLFQRQLGLSPDRFMVVPNGSELPHDGNRNPRPSTDTLIVSVGRLERYKGHQRIITALPEILEHRPSARLLILGTGPFEYELRKIAKDSGVADRVEIRAIPPGRREEMAATLEQAALVVLLSDYEAHPVAVMEALALGRPVLATHVAGLAELAERGLVRSVPLDSQPDELAAAVLAQLQGPLIPAGVELPTWEDCTASLLSVYHRILDETPCAS